MIEENIIRTRNLEKIYNLGEVEVRALRGINVQIKVGEYLSIMGPSG